MKRRILILLLILVLVLSACGSEKVRTVEYRGITFTLDTENQTITQDGTVYQYEVDGSRYTITYPDGATYTMTWSGNIGTGGGSGPYYDTPRLDGDVLVDLLRTQQKQKDPDNVIWSLICIGLVYQPELALRARRAFGCVPGSDPGRRYRSDHLRRRPPVPVTHQKEVNPWRNSKKSSTAIWTRSIRSWPRASA